MVPKRHHIDPLLTNLHSLHEYFELDTESHITPQKQMMFRILPRIEQFVAKCFSIRLQRSLSGTDSEIDKLLSQHQECVLPTHILSDIIRDNRVVVFNTEQPLHENAKLYEGPIPEYQIGNPHTAKFKLQQTSSSRLSLTSSEPSSTKESSMTPSVSSLSELFLHLFKSERTLHKSDPHPDYQISETSFLSPITGKRKALFIGINCMFCFLSFISISLSCFCHVCVFLF
jgi:hypothetical protein